jgi:hypothetical protein
MFVGFGVVGGSKTTSTPPPPPPPQAVSDPANTVVSSKFLNLPRMKEPHHVRTKQKK